MRLSFTPSTLRLVHHHELLGEGRGPGHGHALVLAAREGFDQLVDALDGGEAEFGQLLPGAGMHLRLVEHLEILAKPALALDLAAEKGVVGDREGRGRQPFVAWLRRRSPAPARVVGLGAQPDNAFGRRRDTGARERGQGSRVERSMAGFPPWNAGSRVRLRPCGRIGRLV